MLCEDYFKKDSNSRKEEERRKQNIFPQIVQLTEHLLYVRCYSKSFISIKSFNIDIIL